VTRRELGRSVNRDAATAITADMSLDRANTARASPGLRIGIARMVHVPSRCIVSLHSPSLRAG
jgi:hypothetical protein